MWFFMRVFFSFSSTALQQSMLSLPPAINDNFFGLSESQLPPREHTMEDTDHDPPLIDQESTTQ